MTWPQAPDQIASDWLAQQLGLAPLGSDFSLRVEAMSGGQISSTCRLHLDGAGDLTPDTLICKLPSATPYTRTVASFMGLYANELGIYRHPELTTQVVLPRCFCAAGLGPNDSFLLLLEDLRPARQVIPEQGCHEDDARTALRAAAALHRPWLGSELLQRVPFLVSKQQREWAGVRSMSLTVQLFVTHYGHHFAAADLRVLEALPQVYPRVLQARMAQPTLQHGDFRLQNLLFDVRGEAGRVAVLDWQAVRIGSGLADVASFLGGSLTPELRRGIERSMVEYYISELERQGTLPQTPADWWEEYQRMTLYPLGATLLSILIVQNRPETDELLLLLRRHLQQVIDHGALERWR